MDQADTVLAAVAPEGWALVTFQLLRRHMVREREGLWAGAIDYRARLLKAG
jgi:hypothetical protein